MLVPRGASPRTAAAWSVFSSLPQPLMAVPAFLFVEAFSEFLPIGLGFAAGAMLWLVVADLIPEALEATHPWKVAYTVAGSAARNAALRARPALNLSPPPNTATCGLGVHCLTGASSDPCSSGRVFVVRGASATAPAETTAPRKLGPGSPRRRRDDLAPERPHILSSSSMPCQAVASSSSLMCSCTLRAGLAVPPAATNREQSELRASRLPQAVLLTLDR